MPIVCVDTTLFIMVLAPGTPSSFEVENVEVWIAWFDLMKQVDGDFIFAVCKGAQLTVLTILHVVRIRLTKFTFILFRMIELFDSIVSL